MACHVPQEEDEVEKLEDYLEIDTTSMICEITIIPCHGHGVTQPIHLRIETAQKCQPVLWHRGQLDTLENSACDHSVSCGRLHHSLNVTGVEFVALWPGLLLGSATGSIAVSTAAASMSEAEVTSPHAFTGRMCAASRWIESQRKDSLFNDPLGQKLAGEVIIPSLRH